jgi:hypothetical protein
MGALKSTLTVLNPPYHLRNLVGDSWNSYLYQSFPHLVGNFKHALQGQRAIQHIHKAEGELALGRRRSRLRATSTSRARRSPTSSSSSAPATPVSSTRASTAATSSSWSRVPSGPGHHPLDTIRRIGQARENLVRLNTFASALKKGMTDREAARVAMEHHFDYGDLSHAEKTLLAGSSRSTPSPRATPRSRRARSSRAPASTPTSRSCARSSARVPG